MALLEETLVDSETGRVVNSNVAEYLMPVNADVPDIQTIIVENDEQTSNPLGVKGIGELPMVGRRGGDRQRGLPRHRGTGSESADPDRGYSGVTIGADHAWCRRTPHGVMVVLGTTIHDLRSCAGKIVASPDQAR